MNTFNRGRNLIFVAIFLTLLAFPISKPVHAQTFSLEQESQIKAIIQQITDLQIQLLLARIAELQTQIATLIAQQASTTQAVANLQPVMGAVATPSGLDVTLGTPYCYDADPSKFNARLPITVSGEWANGLVKIIPTADFPNVIFAGQSFTHTSDAIPVRFDTRYQTGTSTIRVELGNGYIFTKQIVLGNPCQ